ncbi:MAG: hypothetical protein K0B02_02460 [DPANN group archaeon]|nr:hypothetical protein [DPANN group archaeon]
MDKNKGLMLVVFTFILSFIFLYLSHFNLDLIISPSANISTAMSAGDFSFGMNFSYFIMFLLTVPIPFIIFFKIVIADLKSDYSILITPLLLSIFTLFFGGFTFFNIVASLSVFISFFIVFKGAKISDIYKKPPYKKLAGVALSKAFSVFSLIFTFALLIYVFNNPLLASNEIDSMLTSTLNMSEDDLGDIQSVAIESQKNANYAMLEGLEQALLYSVFDESYGLTPLERQKCFSALNSSMVYIDKDVKANIDAQFDLIDSTFDDLDVSSSVDNNLQMLSNLFDIIKFIYPLMVAFTMFFFFRIAMFFTGILSFVYLLFVKFDDVYVVENMPISAQSVK